MAIGDEAGRKAVELLNLETIPRLVAALDNLVRLLDDKIDEDLTKLLADAHGIIDRLNGLTITIHIPDRNE